MTVVKDAVAPSATRPVGRASSGRGRRHLVGWLFVGPLAIGIGVSTTTSFGRHCATRGLFRTAYFTPFVTNVVAISLVWFQLYAPDTGIINHLLSFFGIEGRSWLTDSTWAMPAVIIVAEVAQPFRPALATLSTT